MLMISSGTRSASASAKSVLPHAVGPVTHRQSMRSLTLLPAQKQPIEILERHGGPCRPTVIARFTALGPFHLAQERIHFFDAEPAVRAHCCMAGHRRQQLVA